MYQPKKKNAYEFTKSENAASQQVPYRIGGHDAAILGFPSNSLTDT